MAGNRSNQKVETNRKIDALPSPRERQMKERAEIAEEKNLRKKGGSIFRGRACRQMGARTAASEGKVDVKRRKKAIQGEEPWGQDFEEQRRAAWVDYVQNGDNAKEKRR